MQQQVHLDTAAYIPHDGSFSLLDFTRILDNSLVRQSGPGYEAKTTSTASMEVPKEVCSTQLKPFISAAT